MPSDSHETLYRQLKEITAETKSLLADGYFEKLPDAMETHRDIMSRLEDAGEYRNPELLTLITDIRDETRLLEKEIENRISEIQEKLKVTSTKRKIGNAYGPR